jgi:hypothetical protein
LISRKLATLFALSTILFLHQLPIDIFAAKHTFPQKWSWA